MQNDTMGPSTRPAPRNSEVAIRRGDFKGKVMRRLATTPHEMNIIGVLYSTCWTSHNNAMQEVGHEIFIRAGITATADEVMALVTRGWVMDKTQNRSGFPTWSLHSAGCRAYEALYYGEKDGLWPAKSPVMAPSQILDARRASTLNIYDPGRPKIHLTEQDQRYMEILRALEEQRKVLDRVMDQQDAMVKWLDGKFHKLKEQNQ